MTQVHRAVEQVPDDGHHDAEHGHDHDHEHGSWWGAVAGALHLPGFSHARTQPKASDALYSNELGIRTVRLAFLLLGLTTLVQIAITLLSGSVALLADAVHNMGDALNSLPLWLAFVLARRAANRRYTYGFGRAEDLAGLVIVASILFSAGYILWESVHKLIDPQPLVHPGWVALAALVGFFGNEAVALIQIRVGRQIGSEALIADGLHARTDGLTSLAVLPAVGGALLGAPILDPLMGLLIGIAILFICRDATAAIWRRLMDAVDPALVAQAERVLASHPEVKQVVRLQMRWIGHRLHAGLILALDDTLSLTDSDAITDHIRHHLLHEVQHIYDVVINAVPWKGDQTAYWKETKHHFEREA